MAKIKNVREEFTKKTKKIITLTKDEQIIDILSLMLEEFAELEEEDSEFINAMNVNINSSLDRLTKEVKKNVAIETIAETLRDIKTALAKRYNLISDFS